MRVLVVNAGSASLKLQVLGDGDEVEAERYLDPWGGGAPGAATGVAEVLAGCDAVAAVGHRVVHGGERSEAVEVTPGVLEELDALTPLAPLHQPRAVVGIEAAREALPGLPQVAAFDTAFHTTMPRAARTYALPAAWRASWGLRRHGFHGLSHAWAARRVPELVGEHPVRRLVTCHLGGGGSLCAVLDGRSVDTTMGFTPLEGVVMKTRSGSVDPGMVLWLLREAGLSADELAQGLEREGGLAALSGTSGDIREVLAAADRGDEAATSALDVYARSLRHAVAAMAASLGGLEVLAFTGGAGEHSTRLRALVCEGLGFLGVGLDPERNDATEADGDVTGRSAGARTVVVTSREDLEIAAQVRALLA